ncbi:MAG: hypothetical protein C5S48_00300 [Candidatus Methanogaster sp.]|nr:MAG: hypothetical protein C5S48_00300 [ANME-2 cluster archaeon]
MLPMMCSIVSESRSRVVSSFLRTILALLAVITSMLPYDSLVSISRTSVSIRKTYITCTMLVSVPLNTASTRQENTGISSSLAMSAVYVYTESFTLSPVTAAPVETTSLSSSLPSFSSVSQHFSPSRSICCAVSVNPAPRSHASPVDSVFLSSSSNSTRSFASLSALPLTATYFSAIQPSR